MVTLGRNFVHRKHTCNIMPLGSDEGIYTVMPITRWISCYAYTPRRRYHPGRCGFQNRLNVRFTVIFSPRQHCTMSSQLRLSAAADCSMIADRTFECTLMCLSFSTLTPFGFFNKAHTYKKLKHVLSPPRPS